MQLLKGIVIGLGVLILLGLGTLFYGFAQKSSNPDWRLFGPSPAPAPETSAPQTSLPAFGTINLNLPEGCKITSVRPDGAKSYLNIGGNASCNRVIVVDTVQGRVLGTITP
ncbi:MAG: hypothetical protein H8E39_07655 [Alphaproteobacteria bacterium]|nr:hypothetical protein [Alphaproteobacteria bacterium]